jgi:hypothetical protein
MIVQAVLKAGCVWAVRQGCRGRPHDTLVGSKPLTHLRLSHAITRMDASTRPKQRNADTAP